MSEHVWTQENIAAYVAGGLDFTESERLDKHAADCPACAQALDEARALDLKLAPLFARANPGPALEDRIIRSLPSTPPTKKGLRLTWHYKTLLAAAAVLLFVLSGALISAVLESQPAGTQSAESRLAVPDLHSGNLFSHIRSMGFVATDGQKVSKESREQPQSAEELAKDVRSLSVQLLDGQRVQNFAANARVFTDSSASMDVNGKLPPAAEPRKQREIHSILGKRETVSEGYLVPQGASSPTPPKKMPAPPVTTTDAFVPPPPSAPATDTSPPPFPGPAPSQTSPAGGEGKGNKTVFRYSNKGELPPLKADFFKPDEERDDKGRPADKDKSTGSSRPRKETAEDLGKKAPPFSEDPKATAPPDDKKEPAKSEDPPAAPRKVIIRSGDFEFEVDSFDDSVISILKLVKSISGAFLATNNSEKLPNGKVRGSVVVRIPPEQMSDFILDLRKVLGKTGELKNQRIGSIDVSKQYTDLESHLRGARTMEQRLLLIIKEGKGQIKDLLQAEKELGVWRTRIEEIEGELRYYSNLASMATVTIKLSEKNITSAAAIVENERVQAGIEVEDVEKASEQALKAIAEAKGRVTRSEVKQRAAGQFNAILHFEVAPDAAGMMRDLLRQLGHMARLQIDRVQQTENGGTAPRDGKVQRGNTQFEVSLYNLANVTPRETVVLRVAAIDVPAIYRKLREAIAKAKGHVVNAQLDEQDRQNVQAQLDFHVRRAGEPDVLADIMAAGELLSRQVNRVPEGENLTDAKVLFRLSLVDADGLPPRETSTIKIAVVDVQAAYQKLRDALAKVKARIITASVNEQDTRNVTAKLDFTIRRGDESAIQANLAGAGEVLSRHVARPAESANVTDAKVRIQLELVHAGSLPPRETVTLKLAALDVPGAYESLRAAVAKAKGRLIHADLNEQDRRNITAKLQFHVPRDEEPGLQAALGAAGEVLTRQAERKQDDGNVTDTKVGFDVSLIVAANIAPRETTTLAIEAPNVGNVVTLAVAQVKEVQGRTVDTQVGQERSGQVTARIVFDVPLSQSAALVEKFKEAGIVRVHQVARDPQAPEGRLALARISLTVSNTPLVPSGEQGLWSQIRSGLSFSLYGLAISAKWLIVGLLFVLPWALLLFAVYWLARRMWATPELATMPAAAAAETPGSPVQR